MLSATTTFQVPFKTPQRRSKPGRRATRLWTVTQDPSGDFLGRCFRAFDLHGAVDNYWPEGITFENQKTKERWIWTNEKFTIIKAPQKVI